MPLYQYQCLSHGSFEQITPLQESQKTVPCPQCGTLSKKKLTAPALRGLSRAVMTAHEKNERSREAPHVCKSGCRHQASSKEPSQKKPAFQSYKGKRPWVIEHA